MIKIIIIEIIDYFLNQHNYSANMYSENSKIYYFLSNKIK